MSSVHDVLTRRGVWAAAILLLVAISSMGIATVESRSSTNPRLADKIGPAGARDAVERFVGHKVDGSVTGPKAGSFHSAYELEAPDLVAVVDAFDWQVLFLLNADARGSGKPVSKVEATQIAAGYLLAHGVATNGLVQTTARRNHGSARSFEVAWRAMKDKVLLPVSVTVEVDAATGAVTSFTAERMPYDDPPSATVTEQQAVAIALEAAALDEAVATSTELAVTFEPETGRQLLVWRVDVEAPLGEAIEAAQVDVDAFTGSPTVVGRG